ncbi:MAG: glycosyltransferase [Chitinophagales bacterium]|nr:glycosyltransferase [Chitinophagales bacterium]
MTVLFCLSHIKKSLQWFWFAEQLKKEGINQVYVIIDINADEDLYLCDDLAKLDLPVYKLPHTGKWSHIKNMLMVSDLIKEYNVDLIHSSLPFGNLVGQVAGRMAGLNKLVTTCENVSWAHDFNNKKQERLDKFTFNTAQRVIATSDIARKYLDENWDFDKSKLSTIYHGVKPADYEVSPERVQAVREQLKDLNLENSFVVGVLSRFEFWKGHQFIIEAARLLKDYPEIRFFIFGVKGSFYDEAMQLIEEYGLEDKVVYGGFVNDTSALYQLFDVHLHVPIDEHVETGGITIIEGMIAQRPQILTLSGYAYQSARHMVNAYVVPFKDAEAIAKAVIFMKQNPEEAKRMAAQAKKDAYAFSVQEKTRMHISLYNELLS